MTHNTVKDLMLPLNEYATVSAEETIKDALTALSRSQLGLTVERHHHRAILVLNEKGDVVGKLSHWAILRKLEPKVFSAQDLTRLNKTRLSPDYIEGLEEELASQFSNLHSLCKNASRIKAKDAMVPVVESIDENTPLVNAVHQFVVTHAQTILVTRGAKTVGILRLCDVFQEVADIIRKDDDSPAD